MAVLGDVLMCVSETRCRDKQTMKATDNLTINADQLHAYMKSVFPTRNRVFQQDNAPCYKTRIVLQWLQKHNAEPQLMSWPPNSPDFNSIKPICGAKERQIGAKRTQCRNIPDLRDRFLNIWYNLFPAAYQGFVASMSRHVAPVFRIISLSTRY